MKVIKHLHLVLMIKDIFKNMELIHYHMDTKTYPKMNKSIFFSFLIYAKTFK